MDDFALLAERARLSWRSAGRPGRVAAAVSGGADSAALLLTLRHLSREEGFFLTVFHIDHGLRPASGEDAAFVSSLCASLCVPCLVRRLSISAPGEEGARNARYEALLALCAQERIDALALAHHSRDQAETVLLHLLRGSGGAGLSAMKETSVRALPEGGTVLLWRPFLTLPPESLRAGLISLGVAWREDETNAEETYLRNYLRRAVLPAIEKRVPKAREALCRSAEILGQEEDYFRQEALSFLRRHACLDAPCRWVDAPALFSLHPALMRRALRAACPVPLDFRQTEALRGLTAGQTVNLPQGWRATLGASGLFLHFLSPVPESDTLTPVDVLPYEGQTGDGKRLQALPRAVYKGCVLRTWRTGDTIRPLGGPGVKSLQDYLTDRRIDAPFRRHLPLLCRGSEVIWAVGVGPSEEARVTPGGDHVLLRYTGRLPGMKSST